MKQHKTFLPWLIVLVVFVALMVGSLTPQAVAQLEGVTNFNGIGLSQTTFGTATPQLMVQNGGSNVSIEVRNGSATPVWSVGQTGAVVQSAALDMGNQLITNIGNASTDFVSGGGLTLADDLNMSNQPILNVGASGTDFGTSGGLTLADDLDMSAQPIVNIGNAGTDFGTDGGLTTAAGIGITAGGLTVTAGTVAANAGITVDSTAFSVADTSGNTQIAGTLGVTGTTTLIGALDMTQVNSAGAAGNPFDYTGTLGAMTSDDFTLFDINLTNADHSGSNTLQIFDIANITGDAETVESAFKIGSGFDSDLNFTTSGEVAVDGTVVATIKDPAGADSNTTTDLFEIAGTTPVDTASTNVHNFITVDAAIGDSSAGTNSVRGVQIDGITGDAQVTETGLNIDTGWDVGVDLNGTPLYIGADGGVTLDETSDDVVALTLGAGAGTFTVGTGNLKVGAGSPTVSQDGQDAFISDQLEVDGEAQFDGAIDANSTSSFAGNATFDAFQISTSASITPTDGADFTPATGIVILTPAEEVTPTVPACTNGASIILYNSENQTINLADGGNFILTGAQALTQYDTVPLACIGAKWVQVGPVSAN